MEDRGKAPSHPLQVGPYRVLGILATGGMGTVYRALRAGSEQPVALKCVRLPTPTLRGALRAEVAVLQTLQHDGVVRVVEQGEESGQPWYAMELLEGSTLGNLNRELWGSSDSQVARTETTTLPPRSGDKPQATVVGSADADASSPAAAACAVSWGARPSVGLGRPQVAKGRLAEVLEVYHRLCIPLGYVHSNGVVHRDIKPANTFIRDNGHPVLVDFGLISYARGAIGRESLVTGAQALGTVNYVAPEQLQGHLVDARADLYSLGCMLFETLTGRRPFLGTRAEVLDRHLHDVPRRVSELVAGVPAELDELVAALLAKSPRDRVAYAADVAEVLGKLRGDALELPAARYLYRPQIVGRQALLARLAELADRATQGEGQMVLLDGESGIGKTFTVAEFVQRARRLGRTVIVGECSPPSDRTSAVQFAAGALHPVRGWLRWIASECHRWGPDSRERVLGQRAALLGAYEPELMTFADRSATFHAQEIPGQAARERLLRDLTDTLFALNQLVHPLVLVLDDLQWADELTLALLGGLASDVCRRGILVVGTYRGEEMGPDLRALVDGPDIERLEVERLPANTVESMTREMLALRSSPPAPLTRFLAERSEGNPFFVAEYLRLLVAEGVLSRAGGRWMVAGSSAARDQAYEALPIPQSLQAIVDRRLAGLDEGARAVVQAAAVIGREFDLDVLVEVAAMDGEGVQKSLLAARSQQVVEPAGQRGYRFVHDKLRETAYATISGPRLQALHRATGAALEKALAGAPEIERRYADLARHFKLAENAAKAVEYLERAGEAALSRSANRQAALLLQEAVAQVDGSGHAVTRLRYARWHRLIGDALLAEGHLEQSVRFLRKAASLLGKPAPSARLPLAARLIADIGRQAMHRMVPGIVARKAGKRQELLREAAKSHHRIQQILYYSGDALGMIAACASCLNLAERAGQLPELTTAYSNAFAVASVLPARSLAEFYRRRALAASQRFPDPAVECQLRMLAGIYQIGTAGWQGAKQEFREGRRLAEDLGFRRGWEDNAAPESIADYLGGDLGESLANASAVYGSALRGDAQTQVWGLVQMAYVLLELDQPQEALGRLTQARALVDSAQNNRMELSWLESALAATRLHLGQLEDAQAVALQALERAQKSPPLYFSWLASLPLLAEVFAHLAVSASPPARHRAVAALRRVCSVMKAQAKIFPVGRSSYYLWTGHLHALRGRQARAVRAWDRAIAAARLHPRRYNEALALVARARATGAGDGDLAAARKLLTAMGAERNLLELGDA